MTTEPATLTEVLEAVKGVHDMLFGMSVVGLFWFTLLWFKP